MTSRVFQQREDSGTRERSGAWARCGRLWQVRAGALVATRPVCPHAPSGDYLARGVKSLSGFFWGGGQGKGRGQWRHVGATANRTRRRTHSFPRRPGVRRVQWVSALPCRSQHSFEARVRPVKSSRGFSWRPAPLWARTTSSRQNGCWKESPSRGSAGAAWRSHDEVGSACCWRGDGGGWKGRRAASHVLSIAPFLGFPALLPWPDWLLLLLPPRSVASVGEKLCGVVDRARFWEWGHLGCRPLAAFAIS